MAKEHLYLFFALCSGIILGVWAGPLFLPQHSDRGAVKAEAALSKMPIPETSAKKSITLFFAGDIMPSRWVSKRMHEHGYDYPFRDVKTLIASADIAFANLESPILAGRPVESGEMTFRTDPEFVPALKDSGIDVVSLANNHTPNFGEDGLRETFEHLLPSGVIHVGAGTSAPAYAPRFITRDGFTVAFVAQNETDVIPESYCASETRTGTACFDLDRLTSSIGEARRHADYVIFTMHAGHEYTREPNARQREFAHAAIDAGADIVVGHHPHVIQNKEEYEGKPIYYSLGNFIFDQDWSEATRTGLVLLATIDRSTKEITEIREIIVDIVDYAQPIPRYE